MSKSKELLPLGSIVYLEGGTVKVMIVGRGAVLEQEGTNVYSDYVGVIYPRGINPENAAFFNHESIEKVVFRGFEDEEEFRYMEIYEDWEKGLDIEKMKVED